MEAARLERTPARAWPWPKVSHSAQQVVYFALVLVIGNLVLVPLVMVLLTALNLGPSAREANLSLEFFRQAWTSSTTWRVMLNTAIFAIGSTSLALVIGVFF